MNGMTVLICLKSSLKCVLSPSKSTHVLLFFHLAAPFLHLDCSSSLFTPKPLIKLQRTFGFPNFVAEVRKQNLWPKISFQKNVYLKLFTQRMQPYFWACSSPTGTLQYTFQLALVSSKLKQLYCCQIVTRYCHISFSCLHNIFSLCQQTPCRLWSSYNITSTVIAKNHPFLRNCKKSPWESLGKSLKLWESLGISLALHWSCRTTR